MGVALSLSILSESIQLPRPPKDEEDVRFKLAAELEKEGFEFSFEGEQIKYEDFFNEAKISTNNNGDTIEVGYNISITARCIAAVVTSLLLALIPGVALVTVWYLKYSKLQHSIESTLQCLS